MKQIIDRSAHVRHLKSELAEVQQNPREIAKKAPDRPPLDNMGGTSYQPVHNSEQKVKIDWLSFTSPEPVPHLESFLKVLFPDCLVTPNDHGIMGYPESCFIHNHGQKIGTMGFAAKHGRNFVEITGDGCAGFRSDSYPLVREALELVQARLSRLDLALDFFKGELTFEQCELAYDEGEFMLPKAPIESIRGQIATSRGGVNLGRTMTIGSRKSSKMARIYEKGLEVFARLPESTRNACTDPHSLVWGPQENAPEGTIAEQWLRVEIEFKRGDVELDLDMVTQRDMYFAGAYPFCAFILGKTDGLRPAALPDDDVVDLEKMIRAARNSYGDLVHSLVALGFTGDDIVQFLSTGKHNKKVQRSGILKRVQDDDAWKLAMRSRVVEPEEPPF